jgi:uncharacterized RDD family membrane protein YckC
MNTANPYLPPRASVVDVTDEEGREHELASHGARLGAYLLDMVIFFGCVYLPMLIGVVIAAATSEAAAGESATGILIFVVFMLAGWIGWLWATILFLSRNGQTIGKKILGIKAVRSDGSKASLGRLFWLRHFLSAALSQTGIYFFIDVLFIFSDSRQCLHDKIADTIVVVA